MAKGKGKKKKVKPPAEREYKLLTTSELHQKEHRYHTIVHDLRGCLNIVHDGMAHVVVRDEKDRKQRKWEKYLSCDGLPKPYIPTDLRLFIDKLRHFEDKDIRMTCDWHLAVDERSVLTQSVFRKDRTWRHLINLIRPNFAIQYDIDIKQLLQVLISMDYYFEDDRLMSKTPPHILEDILDQKRAIQKEISDFFNRLTYRIITAEVSYMDFVDVDILEFRYKGHDFAFHLWTLLNAPILFDLKEPPTMDAILGEIDVNIYLPRNILEENLTIRGLHLDYDHYSEYAKSFKHTVHPPEKLLNGLITDLQECLLNEWDMQVKIQQEIRQKLIDKRNDYDELVIKIAQMETDAAKRKKADANQGGDKKKKPKEAKIPKLPPEPKILTADLFPDVWDDFIEREQKELDDYIDSNYHPKKLNMKEHEINLRQYSILGGIYQIYFVTKPHHYHFEEDSFCITWHEGDGTLEIQMDKHAHIPKEDKRKMSSGLQRKSSFASDERTSEIRAPSVISITQMTPEIETSPYFEITFKLPSFLCLWDEPTPCHFDADIVAFVETVVEHVDDTTATTGKKHKKHHQPHAHHVHLPPTPNVPPKEKHRKVATDPLALAKFFREGISDLDLHNPPPDDPALDAEMIHLDDFSLNELLSKGQIYNMRRHCIPRILSTLRFPIEIHEEKLKSKKTSIRTEGGILTRQAQQVEPEERMQRIFTDTDQKHPERLFTLFPTIEKLKVPFSARLIVDAVRHYEPQTFFELIAVLDAVKRAYRLKFEKLLHQPYFKIKGKPPKLRIKIHIKAAPEKKRKHKERKSVKGRHSKRKLMDTASIKGKHKGAKEKWNKSVSAHSVALSATSTGSTHTTGTGTGTTKKSARFFTPSDEILKDVEVEDTRERYTFSHWTTEHVTETNFDKENHTLTMKTDRLGVIGFALKSTIHFPFRDWSMKPSTENPKTEVVLNIETPFALCVLYITAAGLRGYVTEPTKKFVRNRAIYLEILEPTLDFHDIKKRFREKNINIFAEPDTKYYIEKGYFKVKHLAAEVHAYNCMAIHSSSIKFGRSDWNRLAPRRDIVMRFTQLKEPDENMLTVRLTPEQANFVTITELCSDDLDVIKLEFTNTWRNIDFYADLHHAILSVYPLSNEAKTMDPMLVRAIREVLCAIRPLSYG